MKTVVLLLLTIAWPGLMQGIAYAATSSPVSQQASPDSAAKTASDHPGDTSPGPPPDGATDHKNGKRDSHHISEKNLARSRANLVKENHPRQFPSDRERSTSGNATNLHQRRFDPSGSAAKGGFIGNNTVKSIVAVRSPSVVRPAAATLGNVRHRGANPATVGGLGNSTASNTGAISGTHMHRRP
jgi:hypothetical protein